MREFLTTVVGFLAVAAAHKPTSRQLFQFPNATFVENIAVRQNGTLLLNTFDNGRMYSLDPSDQNPVAHFVAQFPNVTALTGIAEVAPDVFAVSGGMLNMATFSFDVGTAKIFLVDFRGCGKTSDGVESPSIKHAASIPDATILNGMVSLPKSPHIILSVDSAKGLLYRINTKTGSVEVAFEDEGLGIDSGSIHVPLGANGINIHKNYLYFANSNQAFFGRIQISANGDRAGNVEKIVSVPDPDAAGESYDDFAISHDGTAYVSLHTSYLAQITPDGKQTLIAGGDNGVPLYDPTSAALSKDGKKVYFTTGGTTVNGNVEGGQVVEVLLY
ncbi:Fc.00g002230.m01.CDS01 [Cosmosporella sp. VM-42]